MDPSAVSPTLTLIDWIVRTGAVGTLLLILFGGYYGIWYYGPHVRKRNAEYENTIGELKKSEEYWRTMAVDLLKTARTMVKMHEEKAAEDRLRN